MKPQNKIKQQQQQQKDDWILTTLSFKCRHPVQHLRSSFQKQQKSIYNHLPLQISLLNMQWWNNQQLSLLGEARVCRCHGRLDAASLGVHGWEGLSRGLGCVCLIALRQC